MTMNWTSRLVPDHDLFRLVIGEHHDPHSILGAHPIAGTTPSEVIIRAFHPQAVQVQVLLSSEQGELTIPMTKIHAGGLFSANILNRPWPFPYRLSFTFANGVKWNIIDPYRFLPTLGEMDAYLSGEGTHLQIYQKLGAHLLVIDGTSGVSFAVWAPNAKRVSVIGDFNGWDGRLFPMRTIGASGIWELFIPGLTEGALYKFEIKDQQDNLRIKTDPYAFAMELRPKTASVVTKLDSFAWHDQEWLEERATCSIYKKPMAIYEVHLGSWMRLEEEGNRWLSYREIAPRLVEHCRNFGFTHLELMPIAEHPLDASWGYQVTGYFAPTSRYGTPEDFKALVDICHQNGIGVILDWVPSHFPKDDYSLRWFDGTSLYEHADPRQGEQKDWGTLVFNFGRNEVCNFLLANALFWLDIYHIDGLRVDAVASMLYLDYSRSEGEWIPNKYGGNENLEAIQFLQNLNKVVYQKFPGCITMAEESTAWQGVTQPVYLGGLGFGYKWDMGWMNDTLTYCEKDPIHRSYHHNKLTFSMWYAYSENFILPLSHDEVVYGKKSLLNKMPGNRWQQFANLRLLLSYDYTHPGKKLLFMGTELAPELEWNHDTGLDRHLLNDPDRQSFQRFFKDLGYLYLNTPALFEKDHQQEGFDWIDCQDWQQSIISYLRRGEKDFIICALNFTPLVRYGYRLGVPPAEKYLETFNSDSSLYGGSNIGNSGHREVEFIPSHGYEQSISLTLPPLGCIVLKPYGQAPQPKNDLAQSCSQSPSQPSCQPLSQPSSQPPSQPSSHSMTIVTPKESSLSPSASQGRRKRSTN